MTDAGCLDSFAAEGIGPPTERRATGVDTAMQRCHVLAEIANFADVRRRLGATRANAMIAHITGRLEPLLPDAVVTIVGRTMLAFELVGHDERFFDRELRRLRRAVAKPFDLDGEPYLVTLDYGIAVTSLDDADDVDIVERAEASLDYAKRTRQARNNHLGECDPSGVSMAAELDRAIEGGELLLMYQPKIHVRRQEIASAEGLVRWRHPERGLILPGDFIPLAEECHLIDRLTLWTIRQAIEDQQTLAACGHDLRLFINISGQLLGDADFVEKACDLIGATDAKLGFEITETSVIGDPERAIRNLQIFADSGVTIAIDDYGSGLSSLAYLKQLPARELKIDKLFITQITSSNRDPLIVRSTIDLAHALEMEVVAEGVETHAALALLTVMGCDMVQGFLISRPIVLQMLLTFLADGRHRSVPQDARESLLQMANAWKA